jgi:UDP-glucose 4-epimerase
VRILITGGNGYVGKSLANNLQSEHSVVALTRKDLNLTDSNEVKEYFRSNYFDVVIHCAVEGGHRLIEDTFKVLDVNLQMYYNLLANKASFGKLIHFGSGADTLETPYGLSKKIIRESIKGQSNFYNLRIYAVFNEDELQTRFIKTNIKNYLSKKPITVHANRFMDFFYMQDLTSVVRYYLETEAPPVEFDCVYGDKTSLLEISSLINNLADYKVEIVLENNNPTQEYVGQFTDLQLNYVGLEQGIKNTYIKLSNEY